jgi:hypothetical protein
MNRLKSIQNELIKASLSWALKQKFNAQLTGELRHEAILLNHASYFENIPVYRKLAQEAGIGFATDIETIKQKLMSTDDVFKSYNQDWLDKGDFGSMNKWLSGIYHKRIESDSRGIASIDGWLDYLDTLGIKPVYSSGTSGAFSFVPRDCADWEVAKTANICYLTPLLLPKKMNNPLACSMLISASNLMAPESIAKAISGQGLPDFDAVFLGFRNGRLGNQVLIRELAPMFRRCFFLYDIDLELTTLRCARRGAQNNDERHLLEQFQAETMGKREENYGKVLEHIKASSASGQKVFIFGAPYQFKELADFASNRNTEIKLKKGSLVLFGGGWKSFSEETISRGTLVNILCEVFNLEPPGILEGYSMTEINILMLRCNAGRFHLPPLIESVFLNEELRPVSGKDINGTFGFLDPLAVSYPGFIVSGDLVHMVDEECPCGLSGPALTEIRRAPNREVKGCGGIMGSVKA